MYIVRLLNISLDSKRMVFDRKRERLLHLKDAPSAEMKKLDGSSFIVWRVFEVKFLIRTK